MTTHACIVSKVNIGRDFQLFQIDIPVPWLLNPPWQTPTPIMTHEPANIPSLAYNSWIVIHKQQIKQCWKNREFRHPLVSYYSVWFGHSFGQKEVGMETMSCNTHPEWRTIELFAPLRKWVNGLHPTKLNSCRVRRRNQCLLLHNWPVLLRFATRKQIENFAIKAP